MCPLWAECGPHSDVDSWEQTLSAEAKTLISTGKENTTKQTSKRLKKKQRDSKKSSPSTESPSSFPFPPFRFFVFFLLSHFCFFTIHSLCFVVVVLIACVHGDRAWHWELREQSGAIFARAPPSAPPAEAGGVQWGPSTNSGIGLRGGARSRLRRSALAPLQSPSG